MKDEAAEAVKGAVRVLESVWGAHQIGALRITDNHNIIALIEHLTV